MKNFNLLTLLFCLLGGGVIAQVSVIQEKEIKPYESENGSYYEIIIAAAPFVLEFEGKEIMISGGLSEELFQNTKPEIDINVDFGSYFYIGKYLAMDPDADYLPTGAHEAASLNKNHGARPSGNGNSSYEVRFLDVDGEKRPIGTFKEFFLAIWKDDNLNQYIESDELMHLKVITN